MRLPERSFVERRGDFQQAFADEKKEIPREQKAEGELRQPEELRKPKPLHQRRSRRFFQADRAQNAVVMLGDAFAAEKLFAFGAAGDGFARGVIEATLMGEVGVQSSGFKVVDEAGPVSLWTSDPER